MSSKTLKYADHGDVLTQNLASNLRQSTFADVKLICFDGSAWAHRLVLAAVSPVLKTLFLSLEAEEVVTIYLPQLLKSHVSLVLDYVYKGRMYIRPSQLQHVLGVIEVLSLECGVSVSKKVVKHEDSWTEEAVFESFYDKGFDEVCKSLKSDDLEAAAIEVNPLFVHQRRQSQRNSFNDDFKDYAVVEVTGDSDDSELEEAEQEDQHQCVMCSKAFQSAEDLRIHIQTHLGATVQLRSCQRCKKNFRTALEYDLHIMTHAYIRHLRRNGLRSKWPFPKSAASKKAKFLVKKSLTTLLPKEKSKDHFVPPPSPEPLKKATDTEILPSKKAAATAIHQNGIVDEVKGKNPSENWNSCKLKIKVPSIELTRIDEEFPQPKFPKLTLNLSPTKGGQSSLKFVMPTPKQSLYFSENNPSGKVAKKKGQAKKSPSKSPSTTLKLNLSKMLNDHQSKGQKQKGRKRKASKGGGQDSPTVQSTVVKKARVETIEESLTCPTCDKIFMAKSILERHLLKSKHGLHAVDKDVMSPPPIISQALDKAMMEGRQLPHLNPVSQPKIEVGGRTVNKYECHLCKQVFLRVKDLAKHRERMMCAAYHFK